MHAPQPAIKAPMWLLVLITLNGTAAMHMFVPALPAAADSLGVGSAAMQAAISLYIVGLAVGQLIYGPLSDGWGRRPLLLFGLALYTLAGAWAFTAGDVTTLVGARLLQALGGCAGLALGRAMVRDVSAGGDAVRNLALLNVMIMIGPGIAPLLGAQLSALFNWRSIFLLLSGIGLVTLVCSWRLLPETGKPSGQVSARAVAVDYATLFRTRSFLGFALGGGCTTTSIYAFIAAAPFIFVEQLHRSLQEVGLYLALLIIGMSLGNLLTRRLARSVPVERMLIGGNLLCLLSAGAFLAVELSGATSVVHILGVMFFFTLGAGLTSPAAMTKALSVDTHLIGSAAGFYGFSQMAVGALCTTAVGFLSNPALAAATVLLGASLLGQLGFWAALQGERKGAKARSRPCQNPT